MTPLRSSLNVKLLRDVWRLRGQSLAIALVIAAGVGMVVMSFGMIRSLEATRQSYYERYRFAEIWAALKRAPESAMREVRAIPGLAGAESRVTAPAILDVPGIAEPVTARLHSIPHSGQPRINALVLRSGRWPDPGRPGEVLANEIFASAARIELGTEIHALIYGTRASLRVVGTVLSPEYVYAVAPGQLFPDNRRFGVLWMARKPLGAALDLDHAFNEVITRLDRGSDRAEAIERLDRLLARYGGTGAYGRDDQISDRFLVNEISQLRAIVEILPPIFLIVAAFLINIVLARLVETEREVIGLLKAFGYGDRAILAHYAALGLLLSTGGVVFGCALGAWLGRSLAQLYQRFYVFPFLEFRAGADVYLIAVSVALGAVLLGAARAVRRAAALTPAEAMRPPAPADFSGRLARAVPGLERVDQPSRMIVRGLLHRPVRSLFSVAGLAAALALYIASAGATDNVDEMIELSFGRAQRDDMTVTFAEPRDERAAFDLARLPGVLRVEPFRSVPARLRAGARVKREGLMGLAGDADLSRFVDLDGTVVPPPRTGLLLSDRTAKDLDLAAGDMVQAEVTEGQQPVIALRVSAVAPTSGGQSIVLQDAALNRHLREGRTISGANLLVDPDQLARTYRRLKDTPQVASVSVRAAVLQGLRDTIESNMGVVTLFNTGFAAMIVLGIVYNSARISLSERARDLASLRVLGFRRGEVAFVLLGEQAILLLLALGPGLALGVLLGRYMTVRFSGDLITLPYAVNPATLAEAVLVVAAAAGATALVIRSRLDRLDLVQALKTRE